MIDKDFKYTVSSINMKPSIVYTMTGTRTDLFVHGSPLEIELEVWRGIGKNQIFDVHSSYCLNF